MKVIDASKNLASVSLTKEELITLNNALNEVCNGIDIPEFLTRIGATRQEAKGLLKELATLIDSMGV